MKISYLILTLLFVGIMIGGFVMAQLIPITPSVTDKQDYYESLFDTKETETLVYNEKTELETIWTTPINKEDKIYELDAMVLEVTKTVSLSATKTMDKEIYLIDFEVVSNHRETKPISVIKWKKKNYNVVVVAQKKFS